MPPSTMRFIFTSIIGFVLVIHGTLGATQTQFTPIPSATIGSCAENCLVTSAKNSGCDSFVPSNFDCLCNFNNPFQNSTLSCVQSTCHGADVQEMSFIIQTVCALARSSSHSATATSPTTTVTTSKQPGGSAITTDTPGASDTSISTSTNSSSISFLSQTTTSLSSISTFPTPVPISNSSSSGTGSGSGSGTSVIVSTSTGAAFRTLDGGAFSTFLTPFLLAFGGVLSGACYTLF